MPGIEPGASYMQSMRSTTELHPLLTPLLHSDFWLKSWKGGLVYDSKCYCESQELNLVQLLGRLTTLPPSPGPWMPCKFQCKAANKNEVQDMLSTHNVEVGWTGSAWVSANPGGAASLHVDDSGAQAVDVCLGVMSSTQNHLWTHIHLNGRRITLHELDIMECGAQWQEKVCTF